MTPPRGTVFLERDSYRRRRIMDGARILPVAGFVLILLPVLWSFNTGANIAAEAVYLFVLWSALIVVAAVLSGPLRSGLKRETLPPVSPATPAPATSAPVPDTAPVADTASGPDPAPAPETGETGPDPHETQVTPPGPEPGR